MTKQTFENLVSLALREAVPGVDVSDHVLATLSSMTRRAADPYRAYLWTGVASAAIAACILIVATLTWQANNDSVSQMMTMVSWVGQ